MWNKDNICKLFDKEGPPVTPTESSAARSGTQSIQRIFSVIEVLAAHPDGVSLQQLCAKTGLAKSTAHRMLASLVELGYAVQDSSSLPSFYRVPAGRTKPFGTVHALLCAREYLDAPFATINADDYYGKEAYRILHRMLCGLQGKEQAAMVPYILGNTMSENGGVTRGVCTIREGFLASVSETRNIRYDAAHNIVSDAGPLSPDTMVSMNIWGFHPAALPDIDAYFRDFLRNLPPDERKAECLLPIMVNDFLQAGRMRVKAERSGDQWFGLTYHEDLETVSRALSALRARGVYPEKLF